MLIIKIPAGVFRRVRAARGAALSWCCACLLAVFLLGCTPPGPAALLEGEKLIEQGRFAEAVVELRIATSILSTNAQAWNYLGLAYHHSGQAAEADNAYRRALMLNHDLAEARYNLGALLYAQGRLDAARTEFTAYTLGRLNSVPGLLKLAAVQLRMRDFAGAEKSANDALRHSPENPEAWGTLGLARVYRGRALEAVQCFDRALKAQPDYRSALLNSAIVLHQQLHNPAAALQRYKRYASLKPPPEHLVAVIAIIRQLETEPVLAPASPAGAVTNGNPPPVATVGNLPPPRPQVTNTALTAASPPTQPPRARAESNAASVAPPPRQVASTPPPLAVSVQSVHVAEEPVIKAASDLPSTRLPPPSSPSAPRTRPPATDATSVLAKRPEPAPKRNLFSRLNPLNLLGKDADKNPPPKVVITSDDIAPGAGAPPRSTPVASKAAPPRFPRYNYLSPTKPASGNRVAAQAPFLRAHEAQQDGRLADAIRDYREAAKLDPTLFEAEYNLGVALAESGKVSESMTAYERALAVKPDSADARYNLALALKQSNYVPDAASELEKLLATKPRETRAHLALANLYAQELGQKSKARQHYQRVLELEPQHPQAGVIQYWLTDNPG